MIAKIIPGGASRDDRAGALIGYIEREGRDGVDRIDARFDGAGNPIAYVSRDARDGAFVGLSEHQYVMAVHGGETGNDHLHVAVIRVHPQTHRAQHFSKSYYALDRAMREVELRQGWERDNGPYEVPPPRERLARDRARRQQ